MASPARCALGPLAAFAVVLVAAGCVGADAEPTLEVFAASSLTEVFQSLAPEFTDGGARAGVDLIFAGSQVLRLQIEQGAPAGVFASANPEHMRALVESGLMRDPVDFATNRLVVIVPPDNPARIGSFVDLARARRLVIGTAAVPIGNYTRDMLERARRQYGEEFTAAVVAAVVSEEANSRLVRAKVELGEADAAIVYRTDAAAGSGLRTVEIPEEVNVRVTYSVGVVMGSGREAFAERWVRLLLSASGRHALERHGFGTVR